MYVHCSGFGGAVVLAPSSILFCPHCVAALLLGQIDYTPKSRGGPSLVYNHQGTPPTFPAIGTVSWNKTISNLYALCHKNESKGIQATEDWRLVGWSYIHIFSISACLSLKKLSTDCCCQSFYKHKDRKNTFLVIEQRRKTVDPWGLLYFNCTD